MRKKIIILSLMLVTLIFSFHATWAYFKDSKEYKTAFSGQVAYNNGLSYTIEGAQNNNLNVDFNDGGDTNSRTYKVTITNNSSYQIKRESIKLEKNPTSTQSYMLETTPAIKTNNPNEFTLDLKLSVKSKESKDESFSLPEIIARSVGDKPIVSKNSCNINVVSKKNGIDNDLPDNLGDLGVAGYFHIFAKDEVIYNGGFDSYGNIATRNLTYNGELNSHNLINYVSNMIILNGLNADINNSAKFVVGNNITGSTSVFGKLELTKEGNSNYLDFDKEMQKANEVSHTILNYHIKYSPETIRNWWGKVLNIDTSKVSSSSNVLVYNVNYDGNNLLPITINNIQKKFIIINLNVENTTNVELPPTNMNADDCPYVLWNINRSDNHDISAVRNGFDSNYGTILMPNGSLTLNTAGTFNGNFIGKRFVSNGSTKRIEMKKLDLE